MEEHFSHINLCVAPDDSLMDAIKALTNAEKKIVLVVNHDLRLLGVLTDYDVRMAILNHISFDEPVAKVMEKAPIVANVHDGDDEIARILETKRITQLPVVDVDGIVRDVRFLEEFMHIEDFHRESVAVIMAGGLGTRLRPATERLPKPLLEVDGQPILFILIDQLLSERFDKIYITLNYLSEMIVNSISSVSRYKGKVEFVREEQAQGTAGSLTLLPERPKGPFLVINGDLVTSISFQNMLNFHRDEGNVITMATKRHTYQLPYGIAEIEGAQITALREKPSFNYFINTGVYVVDPRILDHIDDGVMIDMTEIVQQLLAAGERIGSFGVHEYWIDIGTQDKYEQVQKEYPIHFSNVDK